MTPAAIISDAYGAALRSPIAASSLLCELVRLDRKYDGRAGIRFALWAYNLLRLPAIDFWRAWFGRDGRYQFITAARMTGLLEVLDWPRLPAETRPIAPYLADGWTQAEIAEELGMAGSRVSVLTNRLRQAMLEQLEEGDDELSRPLRARANELRVEQHRRVAQ